MKFTDGPKQMILSNIIIDIIDSINYPTGQRTFIPKATDEDYKEIDVPTGGEIKLTFPDGTIIIFTTSEWSSCYIRRV